MFPRISSLASVARPLLASMAAAPAPMMSSALGMSLEMLLSQHRHFGQSPSAACDYRNAWRGSLSACYVSATVRNFCLFRNRWYVALPLSTWPLPRRLGSALTRPLLMCPAFQYLRQRAWEQGHHDGQRHRCSRIAGGICRQQHRAIRGSWKRSTRLWRA